MSMTPARWYPATGSRSRRWRALMTLIARSRSLPDLYVPAGSIELGALGRDMREALGLVFTQMEVDLQLSVAGQFRFTIPNTFDVESGEFLTPRGAPVLPLLA